MTLDETDVLAAVWRHAASPGLPTAWVLDGSRLNLRVGSPAADDCAVIDIQGSCSLVLGSDYVRGVKFALYELGLLSLRDLGWYLATANISDIAAMGALPVGLLTIIRYPRDFEAKAFDEIFAGICEACAVYGANPLGGDVGTAERVILSASALGICECGSALLRSGARPGDRLCVTGPVGTPAAALLYYQRLRGAETQLSDAHEAQLLSAWRRPTARVAAGRLLASQRLATACQDISDGLNATIAQLARASGGLGCAVQEAALPIEPCVDAVAAAADVDRTALALSASVDFELAFAVAAENETRCQRLFIEHDLPVHVIGTFTDSPAFRLHYADGSSVPLPGTAWSHQTDDPSALLVKGQRAGGSSSPAVNARS
jgi:thiamine-monophosphate kinase